MCHLQMHCNDMIHETLCCEVKQWVVEVLILFSIIFNSLKSDLDFVVTSVSKVLLEMLIVPQLVQYLTLYGNLKVYYHNHKSPLFVLSWARLIRSMPTQPLWDLFNYYLLTYAYVLQDGYFLQVSQPKPSIHSLHPIMCHMLHSLYFFVINQLNNIWWWAV